ncbi:flagellar basal-body MS-ring/collar protein FliF [Brytella acorum]|uniref:Flagellar M-ring protein n=1 Tax=Brytella acorum TaxID=2959299 RepID=A0AA35ULV8_9PROT|nr:flagellar basal-body MS-ring/collar protein FliF [Brytella acorum]MDF3623751.1 flagellar basal-body MS-ring/collar protein FliF [Brytella acorum]CAI9119831.1 flagellar basal-body MS-ring/collar protein FliF [Brytella acorum]
MNNIIANLRALGFPKLAALGGVALVMTALVGILISQNSKPSTLLYRDLEPRESAEIADQLKQAHIAYRVSDDAQNVYVASDKLADARLQLAKAGLPSSGNVGYEIFDKKSGLSTSDFEENIDRTRALEGELERSITLIHGIKSVRVHLVLPHRELFSAAEQDAQASVIISSTHMQKLDTESVSAILNLVSGAVPGLKAGAISVVDDRGHVLAANGREPGSLSDTDPEAMRREEELRLSRSVEGILAASLGFDHIRVETNVTMNTDHVKQTHESFDPDQQVLRSQQTRTKKNINNDQEKNVSVENNLPNAQAGQNHSGSQSSQQDETDNYEIGKTTQVLVQDVPKIARVTVAVVIDDVSVKNSAGKSVQVPRSSEELSRLVDLVKSTVGFDSRRGDIVTVQSMHFSDISESYNGRPQALISKILNSDHAYGILKTVSAFVALIMLAVFVVRPLLKEKNNSSLASDNANRGVLAVPVDNKLASATPMLTSSSGLMLESPENVSEGKSIDEGSLISMRGVDGQIRLSAIQAAAELVNSRPDESLAVLRSWLSPAEGG